VKIKTEKMFSSIKVVNGKNINKTLLNIVENVTQFTQKENVIKFA